MKQKIAFAMIMGLITTGVISFTVITVNIGFVEQFVSIWAKSWGIAYLVVIPMILLIGPMIQRLVDSLFESHL